MTKLINDDDPSRKYLKEMRTAILYGDVPSLLSFVRAKTDLNADLGEVEQNGRTYSTCTPLCLAALTGQSEMARLLIQYGASLERSTYSMQFEGTDRKASSWQATAVFAAATHGDLGLLQELIASQADVHGRLDTGANLLWHATQFSHADIIDWLLHHSVNPRVIAWSPEEDGSRHKQTSLHIAARQGSSAIVRALISARADVGASDEFGLTSLDEAIVNACPRAVTLLLEGRAELLSAQPPPVKTFRHEGGDVKSVKVTKSSLQLLFDHGNAMTIAAAAEGLKYVPEQASLLHGTSADYLVQFLRTPGNAPLNIFHAMFHHVALKFFDGSRQYDIKTAYLPDSFNVVEGPDEHELRKFKAHQDVQPAFLDFVKRLAPQSRQSPHDVHIPIDTFRCVVPEFTLQAQILEAIVCGPNVSVFDEPGCKALVEFWHQQWRLVRRLDVVSSAIHVFILLLASLSLYSAFGVEVSMWLWISLLMILWIFNWLEVLAQLLGFFAFGLGDYCWRDPSHWFDILRLLMSGAVIGGLVIRELGGNDSNSTALGVLLGVAVSLRWMALFRKTRVCLRFGERIQPIVVAMRGIYPITAVITFGIFGLAHSYYALGLQHNTWVDIFFALQASYRMFVLGDADIEELDGTENAVGGVPSTWYGNDKFRYILMAGFIVATFVTTVAVMNSLIAVLVVSYERAERHAKRDFLHERACAVLKHMASAHGWRSLCCRRGNPAVDSSSKYVWYAQSALDSSTGTDHSLDVVQLQERVAQQSDQLARISSQLWEVQAGLTKISGGSSGVTSLHTLAAKTSRRRRKEEGDSMRAVPLSPSGEDIPYGISPAAASAMLRRQDDAEFDRRLKSRSFDALSGHQTHFVPVEVSHQAAKDLDLAGSHGSAVHNRPLIAAQSFTQPLPQAEVSPTAALQGSFPKFSPSAPMRHFQNSAVGMSLSRGHDTPSVMTLPPRRPHSTSPTGSGFTAPLTNAYAGGYAGSGSSPDSLAFSNSPLGSPHLAKASDDAAAWQACHQGIAALRQKTDESRLRPSEAPPHRTVRRAPNPRPANAPIQGMPQPIQGTAASAASKAPSNSGVLLVRAEPDPHSNIEKGVQY